MVQRFLVGLSLASLVALGASAQDDAQEQSTDDSRTTPARIVEQVEETMSDAAAEALERPVLEFSTNRIDFGTVFNKDQLRAVFPFTNTGDKPLTITNVKASCGCTTTQLTKRTYQPGESGEIVAVLTPRRAGVNQSSVTVSSNDPQQPTVRLSLTSSYASPVKVMPNRLSFGAVAQGAEYTQELTVLMRNEECVISSIGFRPNDTMFLYDIVHEGVRSTDPDYPIAKKIVFRVNPEAPEGLISRTATVSTRAPDPKHEGQVITDMAQIQIVANVQGDLTSMPLHARMTPSEGDAYTGTVRVLSRSDKPFNVSKVEITDVNVGAFTAELVETEEEGPQSTYTIALRGEPGIAAGLFRGTILVHTDAREKPIKIMFSGLVQHQSANN